MHEEIKIPNYRRVEIFLDTETCIQMDDPNFNYKDFENANEEIRERAIVHPGLTGISWRPLKKNGKLNIDYVEEVFIDVHDHAKLFGYMRQLYKQKIVPVIYCHNTTYDITAVAETIGRGIDPDLRYEVMVKDSNHDFIYAKMESPNVGFKCLFGDTMLYEKISLAKAAERIGMKKGEIPYDMGEVEVNQPNDMVYYISTITGEECKTPLTPCIGYCKKDVKICRLYYGYIKTYKTNVNNKILKWDPMKKHTKFKSNTQGQHAKSLITEWLRYQEGKDFEELYRAPIDREEYVRQRLSYCGGFTTYNTKIMNYECDEGELIASFDVNSMYPFIMAEGTPYGPLMENEPEHGNFITGLLVEMVEPLRGSGKMEGIKTKPIPDQKLTTQTFYLLEELWMFLKENTTGKIIIKKHYYQRINQLLKPYFNNQYNERILIKTRLKEETDPIKIFKLDEEQTGIKVAINSIYGKMGEKTHEVRMTYEGGEFKTEKLEGLQYRSTISGNFVCWMGRLMIYRQIKKILDAGFKFLYADTDSIKLVYPKNREEELIELFGSRENKMGNWKDEGRYHVFSCPKNKKYMLINKDKPSKSTMAFSGINDAHGWCQQFKQNLTKDTERSLKELKIIFSHEVNVRFIYAKNTTIETKRFSQKIIKNSHYHTNPSIKHVTAEIRKNNEIDWGYEFKLL